jgi:hypothetical protein
MLQVLKFATLVILEVDTLQKVADKVAKSIITLQLVKWIIKCLGSATIAFCIIPYRVHST